MSNIVIRASELFKLGLWIYNNYDYAYTHVYLYKDKYEKGSEWRGYQFSFNEIDIIECNYRIFKNKEQMQILDKDVFKIDGYYYLVSSIEMTSDFINKDIIKIRNILDKAALVTNFLD